MLDDKTRIDWLDADPDRLEDVRGLINNDGGTVREAIDHLHGPVSPSSKTRSQMLNKLRDEALRIATEHGFTDATIGEDIALMHSELSEALEDHRAGYSPDFTWYEPKEPINKPCGIPSEMADVIIRVMHFCGKHGIDISKAVHEKMAYNESRPFKHGGKKL